MVGTPGRFASGCFASQKHSGMATSKETNKKLWAIHSWVGLYAGIVIAVLSITGSAAVFKKEIDRLLNPSLLVVQPQARSASLTAITQQVRRQFPGLRLSSISLPSSPEGVYIFRLAKEVTGGFGANDIEVFANPYTGEILGSRDFYKSFAFFLRNLHVRLFESYWGRQIVGLFGIALVVSSITGLLIYGSFMKRQFFGSIRRGRGIRIMAADWHKFVGVAALLFNLVIAVTGAWLGLQPEVMKWTGMKAPNYYQQADKPISEEEDKRMTVDYDALLTRAWQEFPSLQPIYVTASTDGSRHIQIMGNIPGTVYERRLQKLVLDKQTRQVKYRYDARKADFGDQLYSVQEALHFGDFGGLLLKIAYCLFGLTSGALSITGYVIYLKRREKKGREPEMAAKPLRRYAKNVA